MEIGHGVAHLRHHGLIDEQEEEGAFEVKVLAASLGRARDLQDIVQDQVAQALDPMPDPINCLYQIGAG